MNLRAGVAGALLALLVYVSAGELLQAWVGLHFVAWDNRPHFGSENDRSEWQRVQRGIHFAQQAWPWKTSLHRDAARLQWFGARGRFVADENAGRAMLVATQRAATHSTENGALLLLEAQGNMLLGDAEGLRNAARRMKVAAPHEPIYQEPLLLQAARQSVLKPSLAPVAREIIADYAAREPARFASLAKRSIAVRLLL